jgi:hypothetical protein
VDNNLHLLPVFAGLLSPVLHPAPSSVNAVTGKQVDSCWSRYGENEFWRPSAEVSLDHACFECGTLLANPGKTTYPVKTCRS